jgi:hypothetical protein
VFFNWNFNLGITANSCIDFSINCSGL